MNNKSITEHVINAAITAVITAGVVVLALMWLTSDTEESTDDSYIVTVEYDCRNVLLKPKDFPEDVVIECRDRFRFIKEQSTSSI